MTDTTAAEFRTTDQRAADLAQALPAQIARAQGLPGYDLGGVDAQTITDAGALSALPVMRKSDLVRLQSERPPLGGLTGPVSDFTHLFQSPGPIWCACSLNARRWGG